MKKLTKLFILTIICVLCAQVLFSCGPTAQPTELLFNDGELAEATVGIAYSADLSEFVEGDGTITYSLVDGEELPEGLSINNSGVISGIPEKADRKVKFKVEAKAGDKTVEAEFTMKINDGAITYEDNIVRAVVNRECTASVATAINGVNVTYTIKEGKLPAGLTMNPDGSLSGTPTTLGEEKTIVVEARAKDCTSDTASITIRITNPLIAFEDVTAPIATEGEFYTAFIGNASVLEGDSNVAITYAIVPGQPLPTGLRINSDGMIYGTPTEPVVRFAAKIRASAKGYENEDATITITVRSADDVSANAGYISFEGGNLPKATAGARYMLLSTVAENNLVNAKATNRNNIKYTLASGSKLPAGVTLYENGTIFGTPKTAGTYTFDVVASADNCATSVTKTFVLEVVNPKIPYGPSMIPEAGEVGSAYEVNVGTATPMEGVQVEYVLAPGASLPEGLTLSKDGIISGTPTKAYNRKVVKILVKEIVADGQTPVYGDDGSCDVYITINSAITAVTDGKLEGELVDFTGKSGGGYSGGADGPNMIQAAGGLNASGGYYVGYLHGEIFLEFHFTSSVTEETSVPLYIALASEIQPNPATFTSKEMLVTVNGQAVDYGSISLNSGPGGSLSSFAEYSLGNVTIKPGENVVVITILANTLLQGSRTGGPALDYIRFDTDTISWRPFEYNLNIFNK